MSEARTSSICRHQRGRGTARMMPLLAWLAAVSCSQPIYSTAVGRRQPARELALVVLVVVDQLPTWSFDKRLPTFRHGYRRLHQQGLYRPALTLPYAMTLTAPGHATLVTGTTAAEHGVMANSWYRRADGQDHGAEWDPTVSIIGGKGDDEPGVSPRALRVPTVGDALKAARPASKVVAIGLKARAALFLGGHKPDLALFFDATVGGFTTSTYYQPALPAWVDAQNQQLGLANYRHAVWAPSTPAPGRDDAPGEGAEANFGITFPHRLAQASDLGKAFLATPFADELVVETALASVTQEQLGQDNDADLLVVSLNSHDYAGHNWGQESWEVVDLEHRQDQLLGRMLDRLDQLVGDGRYAVVLTSDHGATPLIESGAVPGASRVAPKAIARTVEQAIAEVAGPGRYVEATYANNVVLSAAWVALAPAVQAQAMRAALARVAAIPNVGFVARGADVVAADVHTCGNDESLQSLFCKSLPHDNIGDIVFGAARGSVLTNYATGTHHDAPSSDNRQVPLLLYAGHHQLRWSQQAPVTTAVAPTLAWLLGIAPPAHVRTRSLVEADRARTNP